MGFVKTASEVERIEALYASPTFVNRRYLAIEYRTQPGLVERVVPPPLEPASDGAVIACVGDVEFTNCIGPCKVVSFFTRVRYQGQGGLYGFAMTVDTDVAAIYGRTFFGEPKKVGTIEYANDGARITGSAERQGVRYFEVEAELGDASRTGRRGFNTFFFKYSRSPSGHGFDGVPRLVRVTTELDVTVARRARGTVTLRESQFDPIFELPVKEILGMEYTVSDNRIAGEVIAEVNPESFMPYAFSDVDTPDLLDNIPVPQR